MTAAMVSYAFNEMNSDIVVAVIVPENIGSQRVLEKAGFTKEGISKNALFKHDKVYNEHKFALYK